MKLIARALFTASFILSVTLPAFAQDARTLAMQVIKLTDEAKYAEAIPISQRCVELTAIEYGRVSWAYADSLNNMATLYYRTGDYNKAKQLFVE